MTRKRSKYRPRGVIRDPIAFVLQGVSTLTSHDGPNTTLRIRNHSALESVIRGNATGDDVNTLIAAANMATALARLGKGLDWRAEIIAGGDAVAALRDRPRKICTGPEIQAIRLLLEIHDAQLDASAIVDVEAAIARVKAAGRAGVMV